MAVPKKKVSTSRKKQKRSHTALKRVNVVFNAETGEPQLPHHISIDGYYGKKQVVVPKVKASES